MINEAVLKLEKRFIDEGEYMNPRKIQADLLEDITALTNEEAMELASRLFMQTEWRNIWASVIVFQNHPTARTSITAEYLEPLGDRMDTWGLVDAFSAIAGPAWRESYISDETVMGWTRSESRWWRRAALVCTVFQNRKAQGGRGDTPRTLMVCEVLASDKDDMVAKGMSWALRDLSKRDRAAVEKFVEEHRDELPALVKREVHNKLTLGVKNPRQKLK
ncbi:MAG: DNA alkylation repair protein [Dehalococcoidales bacterium]|nr:MAG: DNA alkylation repair protein [Dehalococcoidales bacterium]